MPAFWNRWKEKVPSPFLPAMLLAVAFMGFVAWDQKHWWSSKEDYGFGWLVPMFVAYVVHDRWPAILAAIQECQAPGSFRATGVRSILQQVIAYSMGVAGACLFLIGALYRAGAGASYPGTLAITLGMILIVFPMLFLHAPESPSPTACSLGRDARRQLLGYLIFPVMVWLVSAPMVSVVENNVSRFLLNQVTTVVFFVFDVLGLPIEQNGNVLSLPLGNIGVEEACSGIRSLTGCLFAGSFLAAVFLKSLPKKIALVASSMVFAFLTNLCRSLFLTAWAYNYGPEAIEGTVHDAAGYAVLGLTVVGLLCLLPIFNLQFTFAGDDSAERRVTAEK